MANQQEDVRYGESEALVYGSKRLLAQMNDGRARRSVLWQRVYRAGRNLPPVSSRKCGSRLSLARVSDTFVCHAKGRGKKNASMREKEREGGTTFRGVEFQIRKSSINQEHSREGYGKYALLILHKFHQSCEPTHRRQWLSRRISPWPSYIFAHKVRFREIHERPMIGGCNDRYGECWWADIAIITNDFWKCSLRCSFRCGSDA